MVEMETGDRSVASSPAVGAGVSGAADPTRGIPSQGPMFGWAAGRRRRWLWVILSLLFVLGIVVSTTVVHSQRNGAIDGAVERARNQAQLVAATLTGKHLTKPVTGSSYDKVAAKVWRSVSSTGSIVGVTVWSSHGRVLFSLNESRVGRTPREMRSLITGMATGSSSRRIVDSTLQTFTPVSKGTGGPVAIVEVDQPVAVAETQVGDFWKMLRAGSTFGLALCLLLLGLSFFSSKGLPRAPEDDERPERVEGPHVEQQEEWPHLERQENAEGPVTQAEGPPEEPTSEVPAPVPGGDLEALQPDLDQVGDPDEAFEDDLESQGSMRQWDEGFQDMVVEDGLETQESMRQWREEFKARAEQAELRLKKLEAELQEAPSAPDPQR